MLDVMLIREFGVEEINAQGVAKAFVDGCRMVGLLDELNTIADIDAFSSKQTGRQQLASPIPRVNTFRAESTLALDVQTESATTKLETTEKDTAETFTNSKMNSIEYNAPAQQVDSATEAVNRDTDAIATLFGFANNPVTAQKKLEREYEPIPVPVLANAEDLKDITQMTTQKDIRIVLPTSTPIIPNADTTYQIKISGPGVNTELTISEEEDISLAIGLLEKIRRQLKSKE